MESARHKEIEIKLAIRNKERVLSLLKSKGEFIKQISINDTYYGLEDTKMRNTKKIIRIREKNKNDVELTYKSKAHDNNNVWHRTELTVKVSSAHLMDKILSHIGIKGIYKYKSKKEYWKLDNLEVVIAQFTEPAFLEFMEIEGKSEKDIKRLISKFGNNVTEVGEYFFKVFDNTRTNNKPRD